MSKMPIEEHQRYDDAYLATVGRIVAATIGDTPSHEMVQLVENAKGQAWQVVGTATGGRWTPHYLKNGYEDYEK